MPAPTMSEFEDCERRFQAAVDVIQSLPKNGTYKPSYEVMLRFYGLFKQAVCGPCTLSRPGFWDPVGRYKWEAWSNMGEMSRETAMAAYVDEMKKVAQDVIDTMQINEKNASYFHYFEPLYHVIHDMPRPPEALFSLSSDAKQQTGGVFKHEVESATQEPRLQQDTESTLNIELQPQSTEQLMSECQGPISDTESEVFCDSLEQMDNIKVIQIGAGHGEGAEDRHDPPMRMTTAGREWLQQNWRDPSGYMAYHSARPLSVAGSGQGDRDHSKCGSGQVQQQIFLALRQLQEDMQSVMERLDVVENLATTNAQNSQWISHLQRTAGESEEKWWTFEISGRTLMLLLVWPFVTQWLSFLLRWRKRQIHGCI
ncbi:acyl-CoA-binding domain-containing protein 4 isoform X2 [Danio aesculapii]|uniref:acyl-CoA-binding domain-containing protein 4 isoform X2 n=1 Tax=Danio aesculapii TaxID=1142201 RepID=UPI0024BF99F7|nr:acyl-CoA-binding domain-containing protein 4 isoform X2 [Danio aesculapii]